MSTSPSLALVGAGYWGKNLARNFLGLGALRTLCDRDTVLLDSYGNEYAGVRRTARFEDVLTDADVTQVAIAAPAALHHQLATAALRAGKDVYVEKPLCLHVEEGESLVDLARRQERILMVGHLLQYHPAVETLRGMVTAGDFGELFYISSNRLNLGKIRREENALWSFAPHDISVLLALAGNRLPVRIQCVGEAYLTDGVADTTLTSFEFPGRLRAHIHVSWLTPFKEQKLTVVGSQGMAVFDDTRPWAEKLVLYRNYLTWTDGQVPQPKKQAGEPVVLEESEPLRNECAHFLACCRDRREPRTDGAEGLRVLRVLQLAQTSLDHRGESVTGAASRPTASGVAVVPTDYFVHPTATVDLGAEIGKETKVWHYSHIMKGARIGERCVLGQNVNVDGGAKIGNNVKIQNNVSVYTGVELEDDVFLGPSCVLTNVTNPRSQINRHSLYEKIRIRRGATVGANATIVCGVTLGRYCFIGAGAVVTKDVADYALMLGNPARTHGWMSRHGHRLEPDGEDGVMVCPASGLRYREEAPGKLRCLDLDEDAPLPLEQAAGRKRYGELKPLQ